MRMSWKIHDLTRWSLWAFVILSLAAGCTSVQTGLQREANKPKGFNVKMGEFATHPDDELILVTMRDEDHRALIGRADLSDPTTPIPRRYGEVLKDWSDRYAVSLVADWPLKSLDVRCLVLKIGQGQNREKTVLSLRNESLVETVQALQSFRTLAQPDYNDTYSKMQHGLIQMGVAESHRWATGRGVKVAIIDTGLDTGHPELADKVPVRMNFVNGDMKDFDGDVHGTAIAGVIAATANNADGIVGIAPEATLLALKACWQVRPGYDGAACNSFTLAKAINVATTKQVDIINMSLGGPRDPLLERLVSKAISRDIIVVGAIDPAQPDSFPAATEGVIAVADPTLRYRDANQQSARTVRAPGRGIVSIRPNNQYDLFTGTSLSAAHVSGLAALVRQRKPHMTADTFAALLHATANPESGVTDACEAISRVVGSERQLCRKKPGAK